jgi:hypothetical protein
VFQVARSYISIPAVVSWPNKNHNLLPISRPNPDRGKCDGKSGTIHGLDQVTSIQLVNSAIFLGGHDLFHRLEGNEGSGVLADSSWRV